MDHKVTAVSEQSPLLRQTRRSSWFHEFQWLLQNSLPVSGTYLLNFTLKLAGVFALGRLVSKTSVGRTSVVFMHFFPSSRAIKNWQRLLWVAWCLP